MTTQITEILGALPSVLAGDDEPANAILLYADDRDFIASPGARGRYLTDTLQAHLQGAGYTVDLRLRPRLDAELLASYQEVWFFLKAMDDAPLDAAEIAALRQWMDRGGGVLVTGDHAELKDGALVGLGHAVGATIPRARHLRAWRGRPGSSADLESNDSTTQGAHNEEKDATPQRLLVPPPVHAIFSGAIQLLPDHPHEGAVLAPAIERAGASPEDQGAWLQEWRPEDAPAGALPPNPQIIARGVNWSRGDTFPLMAAWDGDGVNVGRVLADASWHHYVDYNLQRIAGDDRAKILALYLNQAFWLLPRSRRARLLARSLAAALDAPVVVDYEHSPVRDLGERTLALLRGELTGAGYTELMAALRSSSPISADLLDDHDFEAHWVGIQIRRLRAAVDAERPLDPAALDDRIEPAEVLRTVLASYTEELSAKLTRVSGLKARISGYE